MHNLWRATRGVVRPSDSMPLRYSTAALMLPIGLRIMYHTGLRVYAFDHQNPLTSKLVRHSYCQGHTGFRKQIQDLQILLGSG